MSSWNLNVSDARKNLMEALDKKYAEYESTNYYNHELDIVRPIVQVILDKFPVNDEKLVEVTVSKGDMEGRSAVNINVVIH